jgi:hypothetical protein
MVYMVSCYWPRHIRSCTPVNNSLHLLHCLCTSPEPGISISCANRAIPECIDSIVFGETHIPGADRDQGYAFPMLTQVAAECIDSILYEETDIPGPGVRDRDVCFLC